MDEQYSTDLSEDEAKLGFKLVETANPRGEFAFEPKKVLAVVFDIDVSDRIIKMNNPITGKPTYHVQRFGTWGGEPMGKASWKPLNDMPYPTAQLAIKMVQTEGQVSTKVPQPAVIPCDPGENY